MDVGDIAQHQNLIANQFIEKSLRENSTLRAFFDDLTHDEFIAFLDTKQQIRLRKEQALISPGDFTQVFYVVIEGALGVMAGKKRVLTKISPGQCAGEMVFKYGGTHQLAVVATVESRVFALSRLKLNRVLADCKNYFDKVPLLTQLSPERKATLSQFSRLLRFKKGDIIYKARDIVENFYIVTNGQIGLTDDPELAKDSVTIHQMGYFGHQNLVAQRPSRRAAVVRSVIATLLVIPKEPFRGLQEDLYNIAIGKGAQPTRDGTSAVHVGQSDQNKAKYKPSVGMMILDPLNTGWLNTQGGCAPSSSSTSQQSQYVVPGEDYSTITPGGADVSDNMPAVSAPTSSSKGRLSQLMQPARGSVSGPLASLQSGYPSSQPTPAVASASPGGSSKSQPSAPASTSDVGGRTRLSFSVAAAHSTSPAGVRNSLTTSTSIDPRESPTKPSQAADSPPWEMDASTKWQRAGENSVAAAAAATAREGRNEPAIVSAEHSPRRSIVERVFDPLAVGWLDGGCPAVGEVVWLFSSGRSPEDDDDDDDEEFDEEDFIILGF